MDGIVRWGKEKAIWIKYLELLGSKVCEYIIFHPLWNSGDATDGYNTAQLMDTMERWKEASDTIGYNLIQLDERKKIQLDERKKPPNPFRFSIDRISFERLGSVVGEHGGGCQKLEPRLKIVQQRLRCAWKNAIIVNINLLYIIKYHLDKTGNCILTCEERLCEAIFCFLLSFVDHVGQSPS